MKCYITIINYFIVIIFVSVSMYVNKIYRLIKMLKIDYTNQILCLFIRSDRVECHRYKTEAKQK